MTSNIEPNSKKNAIQQLVETIKDVIVVLEDSPPNKVILKAILEKLGYLVLVGVNGLEGLDILKKCLTDGIRPVAVVSDIYMPIRDGIWFLQQVRESKEWQGLPLILMTAAMDLDCIIDAKRWNVDGYLLKPASIDKLRTKLQELFPNKTFDLPSSTVTGKKY